MRQGVVITGASSGIGAALAERLAGPTRRLLLIARDRARLAAVSERCREAGAQTEILPMDVRRSEELGRALVRFDAASPVDILVANAGLSGARSSADHCREVPGARALVETNFLGVVNTVEPLLPQMIARGEGHIGLMSSLAAVRPVATMAAYAGSKAAVMGYGTALRSYLRPLGVSVSVIAPGFVETPMSRRHLGPRPFEISPQRAARVIERALLRRRGFVAFPWQLAVLARLCSSLPANFGDRAARLFDADVARSG